MWKFVLLLAIVHGASCVAPSIYWVLKTLKCSEHRVIVSPHKNLVETPEALDQICNRQHEFFRCVEQMVSLVDSVGVSELSSEIASERLVFNSLCSLDSSWRKRYLEFAPCINKQQTDFCRTPEFLRADGMDLNSNCAHVEEKMENCIAATLSMKCGVEAGQLFHYLLKVKGDDVCQPVERTYTDAHPSSDRNHSRESVFGEIYEQLVKKIGYIPEQDSEESFVLHKRVGNMHEESESVNENISSSLEIEDTDPYKHFMDPENYSENVQHAVSEATISTSDTVDKTPDEEPDMFNYINYCLEIKEMLQRRDIINALLNSFLHNIMNSVLLDPHFLNPEENCETVRIFPDGRINYYSRRRDILDLETIKCYNFPEYFVCMNMFRTVLPRCLNTTVFTGHWKDEFFPEEFDPEFGAQWYETKSMEVYEFEPWVHESIGNASYKLLYTPASVTEDAEERNVPADKGSEDTVELLEGVDTDAHIVCKDALQFKILKDTEAYKFKTKDEYSNYAETATQLFKHFTTALPSTSKMEINNLMPENIVDALGNLCESKLISLENFEIRFDNSGNLYIFWNNQQESIIDTITCGKVNECHPKGEGIWKCVIVPRPPIETDGLNF